MAIRLALVITELQVGGAERCLTNLAVRLERTRFDPEVYSLGPRPADGHDQLVRMLEEAHVPVHFVGATSARHVLSAVGTVRTWLVRQQPDVVQCFLFHANVVGVLAARRLAQTQVATGVRVADPSRWRQWLERRLSRHSARTVCVSQAVADFCQRQVGLPGDRLVVIPNGIDMDSYPARTPADLPSLGIPPDRHAIVCVGRLHPQKGIDWLLSFAPTWLARLPRHDLLVVGEGPQRPELERLAVSAGIADRVHFAGWRHDVPAILAASRLLVLPSRWEGMPNAVLEAMASGRPVLATRTEGVAELLGPATEAQTAAFGDAAGFTERLVGLVANESLAAALGQENRNRAAQRFSLAAMISAYEQLYADLATAARMPRDRQRPASGGP